MIEIWTAAAATDQTGQLENQCLQWLTPQEQSRADRFRLATSRNQHVVGRGMARYLLSDWANRDHQAPTDGSLHQSPPRPIQPALPIQPGEIVFDFSGHGKPSVVAPLAAIRPFNVAHTDGMVLCAIRSQSGHTASQPSLIGVDIERVSRRSDIAIADRYFAAPEVDYVHSLPDPQAKWWAFLRIWTLKEAFIKAIGTGLSTPLADFAFQQIDSQRPTLQWLNPSLCDGRQWQFATFSPAAGFVAAVAWDAPQTAPETTVTSSLTQSPALPYQLHRFESLLQD